MRLSTILARLAVASVVAVSSFARADDSPASNSGVGSERSSVSEAKPPLHAPTSGEARSPLPFPTATLTPEMAGVFCRIASFRDGLPILRQPSESAWLVVSPRSAGATAGLEVRF